VKNFLGTSTTEFVCRISAVSLINVTPLKSQTDFTSLFSSVKGKIQQKYFNGKYPHTIGVIEAEKKLPRPHFRF
jgi:hypothetical protein